MKIKDFVVLKSKATSIDEANVVAENVKVIEKLGFPRQSLWNEKVRIEVIKSFTEKETYIVAANPDIKIKLQQIERFEHDILL